MFSKERLAEAERFALNEYLTTLAGPPPKGEAARAFYARVAEMTGLPLDVVDALARLHPRRLCEEPARRRAARSSAATTRPSRPTIPIRSSATARGPDPLLDGLTRAYGGAFATYAREELGFKTEMTYVLLASRGQPANGTGATAAAAPTPASSDDIRELLALDPSFRLLIAHGYSDMVTPYAVSRYVLDHLPPIRRSRRARSSSIYRGGHMFYIDAESRRGFSADAKAFYDAEP